MVLILGLLAMAAHAPAMAKGQKHQQATAKPEDAAKKKAAEDAYQAALKAIPVSNIKTDPWQSLR